MGNFIGTIGKLYAYTKSETNENISIHEKYIKIPYVNDGRRYYILLPLNLQFEKVKTISDLMDAKSNTDIFFNNVLECLVKTNGNEAVDITTHIDRFMGPDQLYRDYTDVITVKDIIPEEYHNDFEYIRVMYDDLEYVYIRDINHLFFSQE